MRLMVIENPFAWNLMFLVKKDPVRENECSGHVDEHKRG